MTADELLGACRDALRAAGEAEVEIYARDSRRGVARFAVSELGQHMDLVEPSATVRVARGRALGEAVTSSFERADLVAAIREAAALAAVSPETEGFPGFAGEEPEGVRPPRAAASTRNESAERRVARLRPVLEAIARRELFSAGLLETQSLAVAVATTRGCNRVHEETSALFKVWALETAGAGGAAGVGLHFHRDVDALRIDEETERAIRMAELGRNPGEIEVGSYDVVLEPVAVAELCEWLSMISFSAEEVEKGSSPLAGRIGSAITGRAVDLVEDPLDDSELGFGAPFDREGTWRSRVPLVEGGIARAVLHDRTSASRHGARSTGSAIVSEFSGSIATTALRLGFSGPGFEAGGESSSEALVAGMKRGLYICRLNYVNGYLEPRRAVMTGLTRDGCFLVENGRIVRPVGNVRFTDSFLEALTRVDGATRARQAVPTSWSPSGALVVPAIRIRNWAITGRSQRPLDQGALAREATS